MVNDGDRKLSEQKDRCDNCSLPMWQRCQDCHINWEGMKRLYGLLDGKGLKVS